MLTKPFNGDEIHRALSQMEPEKTPGHDGMSAIFYQKIWPIVGAEITHACLYFLNDGAGLGDINHTLIIPNITSGL